MVFITLGSCFDGSLAGRIEEYWLSRHSLIRCVEHDGNENENLAEERDKVGRHTFSADMSSLCRYLARVQRRFGVTWGFRNLSVMRYSIDTSTAQPKVVVVGQLDCAR